MSEIAILSGSDPQWSSEIERLRALLGAPENPLLFPPHFLKATFPRLGGRIAVVGPPSEPELIGFLFPRIPSGDRSAFTLRVHTVGGHDTDPRTLTERIGARLDNASIVVFDPRSTRPPNESVDAPSTVAMLDGSDSVTIDHTRFQEATIVRDLQRLIWKAENDFLYPEDIHDASFGLGNSLVARVDERPVGFLFGFHKIGGSPLPTLISERYRSDRRIESQLMGVLPEHRARRVALRLKAAQAEDARAQGVSVVNWTVDPLLFPNAVLNFGRLRGLAFHFYPDFYDFRNDLNRVPASRLGITWLIDSERVRRALSGPSEPLIDLAEHDDIARANRGPMRMQLPPGATRIAIEIPGDWHSLQQNDIEQAITWRATTDAIFAETLGHREGDYAISAVGQEAARRFLIAERLSPSLVEQIAK